MDLPTATSVPGRLLVYRRIDIHIDDGNNRGHLSSGPHNSLVLTNLHILAWTPQVGVSHP
jgi:hypothetical protein